MSYLIGCDVGGTFTDVCLADSRMGRVVYVKIPTTVGAQAEAVLAASAQARAEAGVPADALQRFAHGTTVATNAILERKGGVTALLVTKGFRDILAIARQTRPSLYDAHLRRPDPLVSRHLVFEVAERMDAGGQVVQAPDPAEMAAIAESLLQGAVDAVAICLLHSYANAAHEHAVAEALGALLPGLSISCSADISPEPGEFERASTAVMNAYLTPPLERYLAALSAGLDEAFVQAPVVIMQSGGGVMPIAAAYREKAVHTCLSGPASGMMGAAWTARQAGYLNVVTMDMGGTSFDVGLIEGGDVIRRHDSALQGFPINVPMFDIVTLGAGGGSIATIDAGGLLVVGPESAGARPGPCAYGKGGTRPTVTDANVVLGRLRANRQISGGITLDRDKAVAAINAHIAQPLGISVEEAASGILAVVNASMSRGMRRMTIERGFDPETFVGMAFGGAGPAHAADLCRDLGMRTVIVPPAPGMLCALGVLLSPWTHSQASVVSVVVRSGHHADSAALDVAVGQAREAIAARAAIDGVDPAQVTTTMELEMRYRGQGHDLGVTYVAGSSDAVGDAVAAFHALHAQRFGYQRPEEAVEIRMLRAIGHAPSPDFVSPMLGRAAEGEGDAVMTTTPLWVAGAFREAPVLDRTKMAPGRRWHGPLLIEQADSTVYVGDDAVMVDAQGNLVIELSQQ
ncbi:hydantoinase/oxoprolinase family protein [Acetobacter fallax]|uniref:Hydantoinase/oxoprolinase family protein n=1 Tax=Acetobacter fallax TaxID=1737473 RepID=A0ABX0KFA6_9PROT|nr:hydantoinase/oxoprolinase family protein [Acetobacter fallax]NHO33801.1 hydantoinase/oxoprolinase family protein [Acetobacter fallax]NHO37362.1 hydantoinase/oxoprolinase family protein [Acetobacter fallax]